MKVIGHQDVREDSPATACGHAIEQSKPFAPVVVIANDVHAIDAAIGDVIQATGQFDSQPSRHVEFLRNEGGVGSTIFRIWPEQRFICNPSRARPNPKNRRPDP